MQMSSCIASRGLLQHARKGLHDPSWASSRPASGSCHVACAGAEPGLQRRPMVDEFDQRGASLEGDFPESGPTGPVELPPAELGNLPEIAQVPFAACCTPDCSLGNQRHA